VLDPIGSGKLLEVSSHKLRAIIRYQVSWQLMHAKQIPQNYNCLCHSGLYHFHHFSPFGVGINNNQEGLAHEEVCKINIQALPWFVEGCIGAVAGACLMAEHWAQDFARVSKSVMIPGHHTWLLAKLFILATPMCSQ